jgi:hypothetical protein
VTLRQDAVLGPLDDWLAGKFEPRYLPATIDELAAAATIPERAQPAAEDGTEASIASCDHGLAATGPPSAPEPTPPASRSGSPRPKPSEPASAPLPARQPHGQP